MFALRLVRGYRELLIEFSATWRWLCQTGSYTDRKTSESLTITTWYVGPFMLEYVRRAPVRLASRFTPVVRNRYWGL